MLDPEGRASDGEVLDLLVDGELGDARRRGVIERLSSEPEGWRRCALVFLEAQCFRGALGGMALSRAPDRTLRAGSIPPRATRRHLRSILGLAAAAALVASFGLGRASSAWGPVPGEAGPSDAGEVARAVDGTSPPPAGIRRADLAGPAPATSAVSLRVKGAGSGDGLVQVPLVEVSPTDPAWALLQSRLLTEDVVERLAESGREVYQRRRWVPVELEDGRRAVIPVDEVDVFPGREGTYQ